MTLRLGETPSEAVVNGGPSVFISPSGPNHIMVQPLPFQPGASFGAVPVGATQSNSSLGTSTTTPSANQEERSDTQSASVQRNLGESSVNQATSRCPNASIAEDPGVRIVPVRNMVAAVPGPLGRPSSEPSGTLPIPNTRQEPNSRVVNINIMAAGGTQNNQESERQIPSSVLQFLGALFPSGEIHVEDLSLQGTPADSTSEHAVTSRGSRTQCW